MTSSFICGGACFPSLSYKNIPPFCSVPGREIEADTRLQADRPTDLYTKLYKSYSKAHFSKSKQQIHKEVNEKWQNLKSDKI